MFLFKNYQRGVLPLKGALLDQPNYAMRVFEIFDRALGLLEQDAANKTKTPPTPTRPKGRPPR